MLSISGQLNTPDLKRLVSATRSATVGPTALYYAGVTGPIISAGMALTSQKAFELAGMTSYWQWLLSAIIAAMSGIVWYLIFMRWSYRHQHGRARELSTETTLMLADKWLGIRQGRVETRLDWSTLIDAETSRTYTLLRFDGADPVILPHRWFHDDKAALDAFLSRLRQGKAKNDQR